MKESFHRFFFIKKVGYMDDSINFHALSIFHDKKYAF